MKIIILLTAVLLLLESRPVLAEPDTPAVVKLFQMACIPNIGKPDEVRGWAEAHHLRPITDAAWLMIFVDEGDKGAAWDVPAAEGKFALSIRGTTQACAVWAKTADPVQVRSAFENIVLGVQRPGLVVKKDADKVVQTQNGEAHELMYSVLGEHGGPGFEFTMLTGEHPTAPFQASLQVALNTYH